MNRTRSAALALVAVVLAVALPAGAQPAGDAGLAKGIAQVHDGQHEAAVDTLDDVVRRLSATPARKEELAQAYLWLGIAYAQLDSDKSARAAFRQALALDPRVSLADGWPAKVPRLFAAARAEAAPSPPAPAGPAPATAQRDSLSAEESAVWDKYVHLTDSGQLDQAEALLRDWMARNPRSARACGWLAGFLFGDLKGRPPRFDEAMAVADRCVALDSPDNPRSRQTVANKYWDKATSDSTLTDAQKDRYADQGIRYSDEALGIKANLVDSMMMKGLFLRLKASMARDEKKRQAWLTEANTLSDAAANLRKTGKGEFSGAPVPEPRQPLSAADVTRGAEGGVVGGVTGELAGVPPPPPPQLQAVRVGGQIKEPKRLVYAPPVYPAIAQQARVQGVVILECTISPQGKVVEAKVLRGIPLLDAAAIVSVKQWEYTPTLLNGVPVPVIMTVTVSFTLS